ncbi:hypothetical protein HY004_00815 [Candidatus Saccharibacteria bacterium]|nr:hypothetical protein [Candidatus Saccharibacteria bacterium]
MKKDVIYIDTEDDITSIIEKVKNSSEKIIALVPPKRVGVLQSAVNLKLLQKSAASADKRIVLITTSKPLAALAAGVSMPIAKNLQSKPELAEAEPPVEEEDLEDDVINGEDLPVGELEKTTEPVVSDDPEDSIELPEDLTAAAAAKSAPKGPKKSKAKKSGSNIPNFDIFRKKLFLAIAAGVLFIIFLIWAIFFAPHATVNIKAKTTSEDINIPVSLNASGTTDIDAKTIKPTVQQAKKTFQADFPATGKKDIGTKATGTVIFNNCSQADKLDDVSRTIPAGTGVSSNGRTFITQSTVTVEPSGFTGSTCRSNRPSAPVAVQAQELGDQYNLSSGSTFTVSGQGSGMSARNSNAFTGGAKRTATIISDNDINTAKSKIIEQNGEAARKELTKKFDTKKYVVIDKSYKADPTTVTSSPTSGAEASTGHLTVELTYSLAGLDKDDVNAILNAYLKDKIDDNGKQKVYDNGIGKLQFSGYADNAVTFDTTGYIGPFIDTKNLKVQLEGKNYEDIRQKIKAIEGVQDVDTKFFPFWISTAPGADKIDIKFVVQKNG